MGQGLYRDEGVVLRTYKLGEADRIVVLFTQQHGKVRAVAKGVRKTKSRFGARLEPASRAALALYEGRSELHTVTDAETIEANRDLREGYGLYTHTAPMLEAVDQLAQDHHADPPLYRMLVRALRTLGERRTPVVTTAFFWKLLAHAGVEPRLDACTRCDAAGPLTAFDVDAGGALCAECARGGAPAMSEAALDLLRRILGGGLSSALAEPVGAATQEVEWLAVRALEHHIERRLRSTALL
jgi:DNA repair protein RecO (recombination protein O)